MACISLYAEYENEQYDVATCKNPVVDPYVCDNLLLFLDLAEVT